MNKAKLAYRPVGLVTSAAGGLLAGVIFKQVWKRIADEDDPPGALEHEYSWSKILLAAALQGAIFAVVKATIDRSGAQAFERATGAWPGD
jgi:hypothetical protein